MNIHGFSALILIILVRHGVHATLHGIRTPQYDYLDSQYEFPPVRTQQGYGYNAKVYVYPESSMPLSEQSTGHSLHKSHLKPGQHATFESVVDGLTKDLLHRKSLPHELEEQQGEEDAKNLKELHAEAIADKKRKETAERILKFFRVRKKLGVGPFGGERRRRGRKRRRRRFGNGMGNRRKHGGYQSLNMVGNQDDYVHQEQFDAGHVGNDIQTGNHLEGYELPQQHSFDSQIYPNNYQPPEQNYQHAYHPPIYYQHPYQQAYHQPGYYHPFHAQHAYQQAYYHQPLYGPRASASAKLLPPSFLLYPGLWSAILLHAARLSPGFL